MTRALLFASLTLSALTGCNCASDLKTGGDAGRGDGGRDGGHDGGPTSWNDFPAQPILDDAGTVAVPGNVASLFGDGGTGGDGGAGGPCLVEPQIGTLYPQNWLRPRFTYAPVGGDNLFELRLHAPGEANDLVVYTSATQWTLPAAIWNGLTTHVVDQPITVSISGLTWSGSAVTSGPHLGSTGPLTIAPVAAAGTIVYWTPSGGSSFQAFAIGDETVHPVLTPPQVSTACVGCHASTPDGLFVAFSASANAGDGSQASVDARSLDGGLTRLPFLSASAAALLARTQQELPVFSKAHWGPGDRYMLSMLPVGGKSEIVWTNLEATAQTQGTGWDVLARTGDTQAASYASFDHSGQRVIYVSTTSAGAGVIATDGLVMTVPWSGHAGGAATPLAGASNPSFNQFYPTFSPDDAWIAFNRVATGQSSYNDAASELFVLNASGGTPTRLAANDPAACSGFTSPGITNSWPKWSPETTAVNGRAYYWLTFSSKRTAAGNPQLYVTAVVVEANGTVTSYPALYLWNQPASQNNHTPAWDNFQIVYQ